MGLPNEIPTPSCQPVSLSLHYDQRKFDGTLFKNCPFLIRNIKHKTKKHPSRPCHRQSISVSSPSDLTLSLRPKKGPTSDNPTLDDIARVIACENYKRSVVLRSRIDPARMRQYSPECVKFRRWNGRAQPQRPPDPLKIGGVQRDRNAYNTAV